jgi:tRNA uridine 5-carboxymethylaminomethyl modification enzyme
MGESASLGITGQLESLGFVSGRMKTGTPPRVDGRSLNYDAMEEQKGDEQPAKFSFSRETLPLKQQRSCYITYTNTTVHDILREGFTESPMYNGSIQGLGPRYCPSIEDKINRFAERDRHQIFVEPEGWDTVEVYVNGFSTSLPDHVQLKALRQIPGFEKARIFRPGYAIEYDYFPPTQLNLTLETKLIAHLYFAGQINGTTGYEEAACQGLMAGINAHQKINSLHDIVLGRNEAYIGVLIDDLVNKGTDEPYRMFTSRAEYRITLRQDNADERLTPLGYEIGLASETRMKQLETKKEHTQTLLRFFENNNIEVQEANRMLSNKNGNSITEKQRYKKFLLRPEISIADLSSIKEVNEVLNNRQEEAAEAAENQIKYESYLKKEQEMAEKLERLEEVKIPESFDYHKLNSLSKESREKLHNIKPRTLGQASRISGVTPADISVLLVYFGR